MRNAFADEVTQAGTQDDRIVLLAGDIGNKLFDDFKELCPGRFFNCGVAEANMVGVAAGFAKSGMHPVVYTITPFITTRVLEQIRDDLCYQHLPAVLVAVGGGLTYAGLGATHHSCEDISFLRSLPGMSVICPADPIEVRGALRAALAHDGPCYIRLGKKGEAHLHERPPRFEIGRAIPLREGSDTCILATGNIVPMALEAAGRLADIGVSAEVVSFHTVKPLDTDLLEDVFLRYPVIATLEEHSLIGGLGAAIAEWYVDRDVRDARLLRFGTRDEFLHESGSQDFARAWYGLTSEAIAERLAQAVSTVEPGRLTGESAGELRSRS